MLDTKQFCTPLRQRIETHELHGVLPCSRKPDQGSRSHLLSSDAIKIVVRNRRGCLHQRNNPVCLSSYPLIIEWPAPSRHDLARADDVPLLILRDYTGGAAERGA